MDYPQERIRQNLIDAGFDSSGISAFFDIGGGETRQKMLMLYNHRKKLLGNYHKLQKEIDCLDYLILQIQKEAGGEQQ